METKVEKHVPSFSTYSDCAVEKSHFKIKKQHIYYENFALENMLNMIELNSLILEYLLSNLPIGGQSLIYKALKSTVKR